MRSSPATTWPRWPDRRRTWALGTSVAWLVPVVVDDRVAGVLFDPGLGPGDYELLLGRGRGALPVALLVDLGVLPR